MSLSTIAFDLMSVTEKAAIASNVLTGKGQRKEADKLSTEAMRIALNNLPISGQIVIGEGERDEAPMLYIGEEVGKGGIEIDISVDPLEGTNLCAKNHPGAITVMGIGTKGSLLHAPDTYMDKIVVGKEVKEKISLAYSVEKNISIIAKGYNIPIAEVQVVVLDRSRNEKLIEEIRKSGASIKLIDDGDICGGITALFTHETGIHALMGIGAAPEGVITACAVKALGGQMEGEIMPYDTDMKKIDQQVVDRMAKMGITDLDKLYSADDFAKGEDILFIATGVTSGDVLQGIKKGNGFMETESLILLNKEKKMYKIRTKHFEE